MNADVTLRYLVRDRDRHGNTRLYVRRPGAPKIRLKVDENHPEFATAYAAGLRGETWEPAPKAKAAPAGGPAARKPLPGSVRALAEGYYGSAEFLGLSERTRYVRRLRLEECLAEPLKPGGDRFMGDCPVRAFGPEHVRALRDRKAQTPEAANDRLKAFRTLFAWAVEARQAPSNPAAEVRKLSSGSDGFATWTSDQVRAFEARHPIGTKARLAFALLLYTGQRRSDVVTLGRQHLAAGELRFTQAKNAGRKPVRMVLPVLPALQHVLDRSPCGDLTFLVTEFGKPFSVAGFGNWFRDRCNEAGLKGVAAHGLRKALQAIGAEDGLTDRELMAIAGHTTSKETTRYTAAAERASLARSGMAKLEKGRLGNKSVPPETGSKKSGTDQPENVVKSTARKMGGAPGRDRTSTPCGTRF